LGEKVTIRQENVRQDALAKLPEDQRRDVLDFLAASAAPFDAKKAASEMVLASVAAAAVLAGDPRH
jgi:hypothetical protein